MARPNEREVAAVERRHLRLPEALAERDHRRVDQSEVEALVGRLELGGSPKVGLVGLDQPVCAGRKVVDERRPRVTAKELEHPVVELDQNGSRNGEVLAELFDHRHAPRVVRVVGIEEPEQWARVEDQHR